jgi:tRNA-dependent cyclodipeptide synthase
MRYRVKVKNSPDWRNHETGLLAISVGGEKHEGLKLAAAIAWINQNFKYCVIDLSDTLQRYNLMMGGMPEMDAYRQSLASGNAWLERNRSVLMQLTIPYTIARWDQWLLHPQFPKLLRQYTDLYEMNIDFKSAVNADAENFTDRKDNRSLAFSRRYILEEMAAFTIMANRFKAAKIYPGHELKSMRLVRDGNIPNAPYGLENEYYTRVNFERIDQAAA